MNREQLIRRRQDWASSADNAPGAHDSGTTRDGYQRIQENVEKQRQRSRMGRAGATKRQQKLMKQRARNARR